MNEPLEPDAPVAAPGPAVIGPAGHPPIWLMDFRGLTKVARPMA